MVTMNTGAPQVMYLHRETIICVKFRENPSTAVLRKEVKLKLIFYLYALYCQLHLQVTEGRPFGGFYARWLKRRLKLALHPFG